MRFLNARRGFAGKCCGGALPALFAAAVIGLAGSCPAAEPGIRPSVFSEIRLIQMDRMPHKAEEHPASHSDEDTLSFSGQLNLILDTKSYAIGGEKLARGHFNIEFSDSLDLDGGDHASGDLAVKDAFVEVLLCDALNLRFGKMLTHFGIYNHIHDYGVTYVRDVPPLMFNDSILSLTTGSDHFIPEFSNFSILGRLDVLSGLEYTAYLGNGMTGDDGMDANKDKLVGGRCRIILNDQLALGLSAAYSDDSSGESILRSSWTGADIQFKRGPYGANAEIVRRSEEQGEAGGGRETVKALSWYTEAWYERDLGAWTVFPFIGYDVIDADEDAATDTTDRVTAGVNLAFSPELRLKLAHHWHRIDMPGASGSADFEMTTIVLDFMAF